MKWQRIAVATVVSVVVLATAIGFNRRTHAQAINQLTGTYRLTSFKTTVVATGESKDAFGKTPQGYIIYGRDGRMMTLFVKDDRPKPSDLATMTDQERTDLFKTMVAYCGTYDFDGKTVTHHIDVSFNQIWAGTNQVRNVTFEGRKVVLTTIPAPALFDGKVSVSVLTWEKVDSVVQTPIQLVGTYRLISYTRTVVATGETTDMFGKAPQGYIIYGRDGRMMILYVADKRPQPKDLATMTDQERVDLFKTMQSYSGTYEFDGKKVTHHVDVSWNQMWTGTDLVRNVRVEGKRVILTTMPAPSPLDGKVNVAVLTWEKVD